MFKEIKILLITKIEISQAVSGLVENTQEKSKDLNGYS